MNLSGNLALVGAGHLTGNNIGCLGYCGNLAHDRIIEYCLVYLKWED